MTPDILLIRPNDQKAVYSGTRSLTACEPPFWIATMAAWLKERGITVSVIDAEALDQSPEETAVQAAALSPALTGILVTGTNLSASTPKMHGAGILAKALKTAGLSAPVFMLGLHPSSLPERTLREEAVEYVVKGEGLPSVEKLVRYTLGEALRLDEIEGLYYRGGEEIFGNPSVCLTDINAMPPPDWSVLPMERYRAHNWQRLRKTRRGGPATAFSPPLWAVPTTAISAPFIPCSDSGACGSRTPPASLRKSTNCTTSTVSFISKSLTSVLF